MKTEHNTVFGSSQDMSDIDGNSAGLVVTSPPYPMIEMWDAIFSDQDSQVKKRLKKNDGPGAFEQMHLILDRVWQEAFRILKPGGIACINIGDATRTIGDQFALYPNHSRILSSAMHLGFTPLPCIIWRKQTNAPNKFMGSGMLPAGAYVTLEHEYILVLRKKGKRSFTRPADKALRRESALFWEERNTWFSDVWFDIKGTRQVLADKETRKRSAAFPFELAYRLISMYSVKGDLVVDPFFGLGTTALAAMAAGRNSVGYEIDPGLETAIAGARSGLIPLAQNRIEARLTSHLEFAETRTRERGPLKYQNLHYGFDVMTAQEKELIINSPVSVKINDDGSATVDYDTAPQPSFCKVSTGSVSNPSGSETQGTVKKTATKKKTTKKKTTNAPGGSSIEPDGQMPLF